MSGEELLEPLAVGDIVNEQVDPGPSAAMGLREPDNRQRFLESMLDFMPVPALLIEPATGKVCFANAAADEAAGGRMPRDAPEDLDEDWGAISTASGAPIPPEDFPRARLARGERLRHFEMQWRLPSGTRHLLVSGGTLPPPGDAEGLIVLVFEDISRQKATEADLRAANRHKDEFLAVLAHELRNPLMPLRNALAILTRADSREAAERARGMMDRQVVRMTRLIDDLLDLSRISRGKLSLRNERVTLRQAVENSIETTQPLIAANRQQLRVTLPPRPIHLDADPTRVEQIVTNLLANAAKYTPAGGNIRLTVESEEDEATIRIRDDGIGIAPDKLTRIFDMFSQIEEPGSRAGSGLGIGLTLVRQLAEMHGGNVTATSGGPGQGSEFIVRLPCLPENNQPVANTAASPPRRVLVVDDNRDVADSLAMMVELMSCEVRVAYDGFEALDAAAEFKPHAIFLDVGLPELDGYEVARRLRARPGHATIALIALTGWGQEEHKERAREAGFDRYFVKPADPAAIEQLLAEIELN